MKEPGLPRKEWGYCVEVNVNGYSICAPDDNWYGAWQGALAAAEWAAEQEPWEKKEAPDEDGQPEQRGTV